MTGQDKVAKQSEILPNKPPSIVRKDPCVAGYVNGQQICILGKLSNNRRMSEQMFIFSYVCVHVITNERQRRRAQPVTETLEIPHSSVRMSNLAGQEMSKHSKTSVVYKVSCWITASVEFIIIMVAYLPTNLLINTIII